MLLIGMFDSPFVRRVAITMKLLELPFEHANWSIGRDFDRIREYNPLGRVPTLVTAGGESLMESGAILIYLGDKTGKLLPKSGEPRYRVIEWLMWQMGGVGPMIGQAHHFLRQNPGKAPYAEERYHKEAQRLYGVLDRRLAGRDFIADEYSIADIATWPWISRFEWHKVDINQYANVKRWYVSIANRPAVQKGYQVPKNTGAVPRVCFAATRAAMLQVQ